MEASASSRSNSASENRLSDTVHNNIISSSPMASSFSSTSSVSSGSQSLVDSDVASVNLPNQGLLEITQLQPPASTLLHEDGLLHWVPRENPFNSSYSPSPIHQLFSDDFIDLDVNPSSGEISDSDDEQMVTEIGANDGVGVHDYLPNIYRANQTAAQTQNNLISQSIQNVASTSSSNKNCIQEADYALGSMSTPLYVEPSNNRLQFKHQFDQSSFFLNGHALPHITSNVSVKTGIQMEGFVDTNSGVLNNDNFDFSPPAKGLNLGIWHPQSTFVPEPCTTEVYVMAVSDIASGKSMTCTLVNLLRGLNLLDRYTLEDLCDYLPARRHRCPPRQPILRPFVSNDDRSPYPMISTRSPPLLTSQYIRKPASTVLRRPKSASLPSRIVYQGGLLAAPLSKGGRLVDFLVTCSRFGSSALSDFLPRDSNPCLFCNAGPIVKDESFSVECRRSMLRCSVCQTRDRATPCYLLPSDWRRGRSDGLVCVVAGCDNSIYLPSSRTIAEVGSILLKPRLSCLLAGRFLASKEWKRFWPPKSLPGIAEKNKEIEKEEASMFVFWLTAWIRAGAVPFLAQLEAETAPLVTGSGNRPPDSVSPFCDKKASHELLWRHRLIFGISQGQYVHLSNPPEVVSAAWMLSELALQTSLSVSKSDVVRLWWLDWPSSPPLDHVSVSSHPTRHRHESSPSTLSVVDSTESLTSSGGSTKLEAGFPFEFAGLLPSQDLSILSRQEDGRWARSNILGQVISTLRDFDCCADRQDTTTLCAPFLESSLQPRSDLLTVDGGRTTMEGPSDLMIHTRRFVGADSRLLNDTTYPSSTVSVSGTSTGNFSQEYLSSDPYLTIPSLQYPGISLFVPRKNKELLQALLIV